MSDPMEQTGVGTPRSADEGVERAAPSNAEGADADVVSGATTGSHAAMADEVVPNRSGSGGSGGPTGGDDGGAQEGGGSRSMEEMLGSSPEEAGQAPDR